jgi:hypothetical protein
MVLCVQTVRSSLPSKRDDGFFKALIQHVMQKVEQLELQPIELPRIRKPPKRYTGPAATYQPSTIEEYYEKHISVYLTQLFNRSMTNGNHLPAVAWSPTL